MKLYNQFSDAALVELLNKGDGQAYAEIFERYKVLLFEHAYHILQDEDEAKDVIQELFLVLWQKRMDITINVSLSAYLYSAVRNRVFDIIAHQKVVGKYLDSIKAYVDKGEYVTEEQVRARELKEIIEANINRLPPKMRVVFELTREEGLSYKEVAKILQLSDKTVKQQVYNAIKILKRKLENYILFLPI